MHARTAPLLVLCLLAAPLAARAQQPTNDTVKDRVMALLAAFEHVPSAEEFTSLGSGAQDVLVSVAKDEAQAPFVRGRAVWALQYFPNDATRTTIAALLACDDLDESIVERAVQALAFAFGQGALANVRGYLDDGRADVREAAARALGTIGGDEAVRILRRRLDREGNGAVRSAIEEEIRRVEGAGVSD